MQPFAPSLDSTQSRRASAVQKLIPGWGGEHLSGFDSGSHSGNSVNLYGEAVIVPLVSLRALTGARDAVFIQRTRINLRAPA
jgi:hypothetical protein